MPSFTNPDTNVAQLGLTGTERVAIFGSGAGGHSCAALRALRGRGGVVAIDVRQDLLDRVASDVHTMKMSGLTTKCADYQRLGGTGMQDNSCDAVIVPNTLFAAEHKEPMLQEAHRIVKPGGSVMVIDWKASFGGMGPQAEHVVPVDTARTMLEGAGLRVTREFPAGAQHYGIICMK